MWYNDFDFDKHLDDERSSREGDYKKTCCACGCSSWVEDYSEEDGVLYCPECGEEN